MSPWPPGERASFARAAFAAALLIAPQTGFGVETLRVAVTPTLDPSGHSWRLQVLKEDAGAEKPVDEHPAGADGIWTSTFVRRGDPYRLRVKTESGDGWWVDDKPVVLGAPEETRVVRLGASALRGTVYLGKRRLSGRVTFVDRDGLVSVGFSTKEDGTFEGVLPRDGWWSVTVSSDRPHFSRTFEVKVDPVFRDGTPPDVEVRVKSRAIEGEVVDSRNQRVPLSSVSVEAPGFQPLRVEGGRFTWNQIVDGWMAVYAYRTGITGLEMSPRSTVRVEANWVDPGFITLEIRPSYDLRGRVTNATGEAVPKTLVSVFGGTHGETRAAGIDGRFQSRILGGGETVCLLVVDPGKVMRIVPVPASETEQDVPVAENPGTLSLDFSPRPSAGKFAALVANGCRIPWWALDRIAGVKTRPPALEVKGAIRAAPGTYALCGIDYDVFDEGQEIPPEACVSGILNAGESLSLSLSP